MEHIKAVVLGTTIWSAPNTGTPSVKVRFGVSDGVAKPYQLYHDLWLSEKAFDRTMDTLRGVLGWFGCDLNDLYESETLAGIEVDLAVEDEEFNGKMYKKVKFINPAGHVPKDAVTGVDQNAARRIAAELRGKITMFQQNAAAAKAGTGATVPPPVQKPTSPTSRPPERSVRDAPPASVYDDDLPF
jgi:hypothetical protein